MNRADLHRLSELRLREAKTLLDAKEYSGAYYLAGYAVECGLKACFAKSILRYTFPDRASQDVFSHDLRRLVFLADLKPQLEIDREANPLFRRSWEVACRWTEESRYELWTKEDAEAMIEAVGGRGNRVLRWIKQRW